MGRIVAISSGNLLTTRPLNKYAIKLSKQPVCAYACRARSVGGAFSQTCSCRRGHSCAEGVPTASLLPNQKKMLSEINAGYGRKGESYHGDISLYSKDCRAQ